MLKFYTIKLNSDLESISQLTDTGIRKKKSQNLIQTVA